MHFAALHLLTKAPLLHLPRPYAFSSVILSVPMFLKRTFILLLYSVLQSGSDKLPTGCIRFPLRSKARLCVWDAATGQRYIRAAASHSHIDRNSNTAHRLSSISESLPASFYLPTLRPSLCLHQFCIPSSSSSFPPQSSFVLTTSTLVTSVCIHLQ